MKVSNVKKHMIVLSDQDVTYITLVDKEIFEWIVDRDTHGRVGNESSWVDNKAPVRVTECIRENSDDVNAEVTITVGSYDNDRAMCCSGMGEYGKDNFWELSDAINYAQKNNIEIVDTYEGLIY